jgi:DUF1680 family protein
VEPESAAEFAVHLRIPRWLDRPAAITVNGKPAQVKAERGRFAALTRSWRKGDRIELVLPFSSRTVAIEESAPTTVAAMRGPVLLTAIDPPEQLNATAADLKTMAPVAGKPLEFNCRTATGTVRMRPFYQVQRETYSTYFQRAEP